MEIVGEVVEDLVGGLAPDEGPGVGVPVFDPVGDVAAECGDGVVGGAAQFLGGQLGEPAFDLVEPGAVGRGVVDREAPVASQLALDLRSLVVGGVVADDVAPPSRRGR